MGRLQNLIETTSKEDARLDNSGNGLLRVPGFGGLPVGLELMSAERFAHGLTDWEQSVRLTAREIAMLGVIEALTDKPAWYDKVFDDNIVAKWRREALAVHLMSESAWDWCLAELRDKAAAARETGRVSVLDAGSVVCKSDALASSKIQSRLKEAVDAIVSGLSESDKDWHPHSNQQVLDIVHPSLYPLVYGRSKVLVRGGAVGLDNFADSCGSGVVASASKHPLEDEWEKQSPRDVIRTSRRRARVYRPPPGGEGAYRYSAKFQWLPCEVEFTGESSTGVRITSYINNLHPVKHKALYSTIEKLISAAIEPLNDVLIKDGGQGRVPPRIRTYGVEWPKNPDAWIEQLEAIDDATADPETAIADLRRSMAQQGKGASGNDYVDGWRHALLRRVEAKWAVFQRFLHPEPGLSFTYSDWKTGRGTSTAIVAKDLSWAPAVSPDRDHEYYSVSLQREFRAGLQVIIKIAGIELTPDRPHYPGGSWHVEGLLNEHIAATALFYFDVDNVGPARIEFRQETKMDERAFHNNGDDEHGALMAVFGVPAPPSGELRGLSAVQELGSVATPTGRLVAFANTLQHRVRPFSLLDPTRPGRRRFVALWLVDPNYRVCSTRNVPPQQHDWWADDAERAADLSGKGIPPEIINQIMRDTDDWPVGRQEAEKLRLGLMAERTRASESVEGMFGSYNFCEH